MLTASQPKTMEVLFRNGVIAYDFENLEGIWSVRFCDRSLRGSIVTELPESLRGSYPSDDTAIQAIAVHYRTSVRLRKVTPRL
ncbi:MAG: hypothetical protein ACRELG_22610 [Gemmataceae bacterium]